MSQDRLERAEKAEAERDVALKNAPVYSNKCNGCGKPFVIENAWMEDGCPCNSAQGINDNNMRRWKLLHDLQQQDSRALEKAKKTITRVEAERDAKALEKDAAYLQRNQLVALLARIYPSGIRQTQIDGWSHDWNGCCYIDLPSGQISYHYHDTHSFLFSELPEYKVAWDGHDKPVVKDRICNLIESLQTDAAIKRKERA